MILIALPMYNEGAVIHTYLSHLLRVMKQSKLPYHVLILNDGSTDNSVALVQQFLRKMPITLIHHPVNKGLGVTLKDSFAEIARITNDDDVVITMDSDNTHPPDYIPSMVSYLASEKYNLIIASRYAPGGGERGFAVYRSYLSKIIAFSLRLFFPISGVKDYSCGYRAYKASLIKNTVKKFGSRFIQATGFPGMAEILIKMRKVNDIRAHEIPLILRYDLKKGKSKLKLLRTIREYLFIILRNKFS